MPRRPRPFRAMLPRALLLFSSARASDARGPRRRTAFSTPPTSGRHSLAPSSPSPSSSASPFKYSIRPFMHGRYEQRVEEGGRRLFSKAKGDGDPLSTRRGENLPRPVSPGSLTTRLEVRVAVATEEGDASTSSRSSSIGEILVLVAPLLLVYVSNQWSRFSISYLVDFSSPDVGSNAAAFEAMNVDLGFGQSQYGLLASTAFTTLFALSSLVAGGLADRYDRKALTLGGCAVWTLATLWTARAHSYEEVLAARVIMGGACGFSAPAAYALMAERVCEEKLAFSNSVYGSGVYLGGALSSLSLLLDEAVGWRGTMGFIGGFGAASVAAAGLLLPPDGDRDVNGDDAKGTEQTGTPGKPREEESGPVQDALRILSIPRVRLLFLASFLRFCSGLMIGVWKAPYFKQAFPADVDEFAVANALIIGAVGAGSGILGGYLADKLGAWIKETDEMPLVRGYFDEQTIRLLPPIVGSLLAVPTFYLATHTAPASTTNAFEVSMLWLAVEYLVAECWFGPTIAVLQSAVGASRAGTTQGLFVLTGAAGNLAPTLLGLAYANEMASGQGPASGALADLLSLGVCAGYFLSSIVFAASARASGEPTEALEVSNKRER